MVLLLRFLFAEADAMMFAGLAGGLLGATYLGTGCGSSFGAVIGAFSALFGLACAAARGDARLRALEASVERSDARFESVDSALETFSTELAEVDSRSGALHEESSNAPSGVHWMSEDSQAAGVTAHGVEDGSLELARQREEFESCLALQVARVDSLITDVHGDLRGVAFSQYFGSFQALADMLGRSESRLQEAFALRMASVFGPESFTHPRRPRTGAGSWCGAVFADGVPLLRPSGLPCPPF